MMEEQKENRGYVRYFILVPVVIVAPLLSDLRLIPEDISANGFQVVVSKNPHLDKEVECSIWVSDEEIQNIKAMPVWIKKNEENPPTWTMGLEFEMPEAKRDRLDSDLRKISAQRNRNPGFRTRRSGAFGKFFDSNQQVGKVEGFRHQFVRPGPGEFLDHFRRPLIVQHDDIADGVLFSSRLLQDIQGGHFQKRIVENQRIEYFIADEIERPTSAVGHLDPVAQSDQGKFQQITQRFIVRYN